MNYVHIPTRQATPRPLPGLRPGDRVYLAARFERQAEARALADELCAQGYSVTSSWLGADGLAMGDARKSEVWAARDLFDVRQADAYVLLSDAELGRGGKDFEGGYAYALGKRVVVVGPPAHVFHFLPDVFRVRDLPTFRYLFLDGEKIDD